MGIVLGLLTWLSVLEKELSLWIWMAGPGGGSVPACNKLQWRNDCPEVCTDQRKASPRGWQLWELLPQAWKSSVILSLEPKKRQRCLVEWWSTREQWKTCQPSALILKPPHCSRQPKGRLARRPGDTVYGVILLRHRMGWESWVESYQLQMYLKDCRTCGVPCRSALT